MPKAIPIKKSVDYVLECDRELPQSEQTVFKIRQMTPAERASWGDRLKMKPVYDTGGNQVLNEVEVDGTVTGQPAYEYENIGEMSIWVVERCLIGWDNFNSDEGPLKFDEKNKANNVMMIGRLEWVTELSTAILNLSTFSEGEVKN